jgi:hypothetical protein
MRSNSPGSYVSPGTAGGGESSTFHQKSEFRAGPARSSKNQKDELQSEENKPALIFAIRLLLFRNEELAMTITKDKNYENYKLQKQVKKKTKTVIALTPNHDDATGIAGAYLVSRTPRGQLIDANAPEGD